MLVVHKNIYGDGEILRDVRLSALDVRLGCIYAYLYIWGGYHPINHLND